MSEFGTEIVRPRKHMAVVESWAWSTGAMKREALAPINAARTQAAILRLGQFLMSM